VIKPTYDGKRFSYPDTTPAGSRWDVLRWALTRKKAKWPKGLQNPPASKVIERVMAGQLRVTFINHATVLVQCDGLNIITDPVFSRRVSPVRFAGPRRARPVGLPIDALPPIDAVLIWDSHSLDTDTVATLVPARHWTSRKPGDENQSLWGGFVIRFNSGSVYFAGDTGYADGEHFRLARKHLGPFRCALLPIGAYEPRWFMKPQHMNPAEAVMAFKDLEAQHALGIHHGTFQLTDEQYDEPLLDLQKALEQQAVDAQRFITLPNGGAWDVPA